MGAVWDAVESAFEAIRQFAGAGVAKRRALQQHHPGAATEGRGAGLFQRLAGLTRLTAVEAAHIDAGPAGIDVFVDHGLDGALQSSGIVAPQQLDRHRGGSSENAEVCPDWQSP